MTEQGIDVALVSVGHDLPYLTGYLAMPLERVTMLVLPRDGEATLVVPELEAPRVVEQPGAFAIRPRPLLPGVFSQIDRSVATFLAISTNSTPQRWISSSAGCSRS